MFGKRKFLVVKISFDIPICHLNSTAKVFLISRSLLWRPSIRSMFADGILLSLAVNSTEPTRHHRQLLIKPITHENCLAINYDFVIMARFYENVLLFWSRQSVNSADWVRSSGLFFLKSLLVSASNNRTGSCGHGRGTLCPVRGSAQRVRSASRVFAQPFLQRSECLRSSTMGILLRRAF